MPRWLWAIVFGVMSLLPIPAFASRTALDGRGLPRYLAADPSNDVNFPGSAGRFEPQLLLDYGSLAMGTVGRGLSFGYILDGKSHNLLLAHRTGWGVSIGISDRYTEREIDEQSLFQQPVFVTSYNQSSRRDLRINLGWSHGTLSERSYEVTVGGGLVNAKEAANGANFAAGDADSFSYAWNSGPGTQIVLRLRTITPKNGLLLALDSGYEDLHAEGTTAPLPESIRRYASAQLGWRTHLDLIEDLVIGTRLQWNHDSIIGTPRASSFSLTVSGTDKETYLGTLFLSGEHPISSAFVARAGVEGSARFEKITDSRWTENNIARRRRARAITSDSEGSINDVAFFLGAGWQWKAFSLNGRVYEHISMYSPLGQWSIEYTW